MNSKKLGFTLAEVLIALGIISVIATMGFSMSKKGVDRAYDLYVYTGYKGLCDAIADAKDLDLKIDQDHLIVSDKFIEHIADTLRAEDLSATAPVVRESEEEPAPGAVPEDPPRAVEITSPNNIIYRIYKWGDTYRYDGTEGNMYSQKIGQIRQQLSIRMEVPKRKTAGGSLSNVFCFAYIPDDYSDYPVPMQNTLGCESTIEHFPKRRDFLLFYLDDGFSGRRDAASAYHQREYYSAIGAFCRIAPPRIYGATEDEEEAMEFDCDGIAQLNENQRSLVVADPRRS